MDTRFKGRWPDPATMRRHDHLKRRTVDVMTRNWLVTAPGFMVLVLAVNLLRSPGGPWTQAPFVALLTVYALIIWTCRAYRRDLAAQNQAPGYRYERGMVACGMLACLWTAVLFVVGNGPDRLLQGFLIPSLIFGAIRGGALLFIAIVTTGAILSTRGHGAVDHDLRLCTLFFGLTAVGMVLRQHDEFNRSTVNEMQLAEQGEIIGILLHDFEEQGSDWLWETDADLRLRTPSERLHAAVGCGDRRLTNLSLRRWGRIGLHRTRGAVEGFAALIDCLERRTAFRGVCIPIGSGDRERWLKLTGKPVFDVDGSFGGYRGVGSDVTEARRAQQRIEWLARHDGLTGLPNRANFHTRLQEACTDHLGGGPPLALLCLDLDGFKAINDTLGHPVGDALLVQVAERLRNCIHGRNVIGRLGGDEFALLMIGGDEAGAAALARRLLAAIAEPYDHGGTAIRVGVSIGIMMAPQSGLDAQALLRSADLAMYQAKGAGRGTARFFDPSMRDMAEDRLLLQNDLRNAIADGQLALHFQPILNALSGRVVAVEALVRWAHPTRGLISPIDFIPVAEESGQICALGAWVLRRACQEATRWPDGIGISVNLSPLQLRDPALGAIVEGALADSRLPPDRLELEITESLFLDNNPVVRATLVALKGRGIRIALDDFGTGFSSLSYLRNFPVDTVKIDRSFVRDLGADQEADIIVQAITGMANGLGITITAEGVETAEQAMRLRASGCTQFQGFLYSRPCTADAVMRFMASRNTTTLEIEPSLALEGNRPVPVSA